MDHKSLSTATYCTFITTNSNVIMYLAVTGTAIMVCICVCL